MDRPVPSFKLTQKLMSVGGFWPTQTYRQRLLRYYIIGFISLYTIFSELCQLFTLDLDLWSAVRVLQIFVPTINGVAAYYNVVIHFNSIKKIYTYIFYDWQQLADDNELKIMQKYGDYGNFLVIIGLGMCYFYGIIYIGPSFLRITMSTNEIRSDLDLYPIISWFDYFSNRETYCFPIQIYQIVSTYVLMTAAISAYAMYALFIQHAYARLCVITYKICSPFIRGNNNNDVPETPIDYSPWIIDIVQCLARTTEFMTLVNASCEKSYLLQISIGFFLIILDFLCISVIIERKNSIRDMLRLLFYISGSLFLVYINCHFGQIVINDSLELYREVSHVPFYEMSLKTQKLLLTTLTISTKPHAASIGKVYMASHEFFGNLLRSALSFAMVVRSIQNI